MLALQGVLNEGGYDWITEADEPILYKMQYLASQLDEAPDKPEAWDSLFNLAGQLLDISPRTKRYSWPV